MSCADGVLDERCLADQVRPAVGRETLREVLLQRGVSVPPGGIGPQGVAECQVVPPLGGPGLLDVEIVRPAAFGSPGEDVAAFVSKIAAVLVAAALQTPPRVSERCWVAESGSDVQHRLSGESGHRRAADVLDPSHEIAERLLEQPLLATKLLRPSRVVLTHRGGAALQPERRTLRSHSKTLADTRLPTAERRPVQQAQEDGEAGQRHRPRNQVVQREGVEGELAGNLHGEQLGSLGIRNRGAGAERAVRRERKRHRREVQTAVCDPFVQRPKWCLFGEGRVEHVATGEALHGTERGADGSSRSRRSM